MSLPDFITHTEAAQHWAKIGVKKRFGVCVPLASLWSEKSCGIGDIADLELAIEWCRAVGLDVLQILPINDMGRGACPYAAISAFAIDPVYVSLNRIPGLENDSEFQAKVASMANALNSCSSVDYERVRWVKGELLAEAFRRVVNADLLAELETFFENNQYLKYYVKFRALKEANQFGPITEPADETRSFRDESWRVKEIVFTQWLLDRQLREAHEKAASAGVLLEGDIPILVGRDSADVWAIPEIFRLDVSAGAPPDMYSEDGQNWGFPIYNWEALRSRDYDWWRARLRHAERYFDLYRIDHVVGFFRIWAVPVGERTARNGWFVPEDETKWGEHGRTILKMMLESTTMLPLAEDLGTIPDVCRNTLREMGICGMKVLRWERRWHGDRGFIPPAEYHPLSVATLSTHDSETLAGWWETQPEDRELLWKTLGHQGPAPRNMTPSLQKEVIKWVTQAGSLFVIFMIQDLLAPFEILQGNHAEHRINVPGIISPKNWTWRCPISLNSMLASSTLLCGIKEIVYS